MLRFLPFATLLITLVGPASWASTCGLEQFKNYLATSPISITKPGSQEEKLRAALQHPIFDGYSYELLKESSQRVYARNLERGVRIELADLNNPLTEVEQAALWGYSQPHHKELNFPLPYLKFQGNGATDSLRRYGNVDVRALDLAPYYELLISGLSKLKKVSGKLYRGANLKKSFIEEQKRNARSQTPQTHQYFFSTSLARSISEGFLLEDVEMPPLMFEIEVTSGAMIYPLATFPDEYEILFPPFASFIVTEVIESAIPTRASPHLIRMRQLDLCKP